MSNFAALKWLVLLTIFIFLSSACSPKPQKEPLAPLLRIAIAVTDLQWDGMQVMRETMEKRSKEEQIEITWLDAKNDPREQERQIKQLLSKTDQQKVEVVVYQPVDPLQSPPIVENLAKAKIKVIALERLINNVPLDGYIAFDHILAGQLQARYVSNFASLQKNLNALILKGDPEDPAAQEITTGIRHSLNKNVQVLKELEHARNDQDLAALNVQRAIEGNKIDIIFATDSRLAAGAVMALKSAGLNDRVFTSGVGADRNAARQLLAGDHDTEVDTMPELMAQYILDAAISLAKTGHWQYDARINNGNYSVPAKTTPVRLIDQTNAYLLEQRWSKELRPIRGKSSEQGEQSQNEGGGKDPEDLSKNKSDGSENGERQSKGNEQKAKTKLRITNQEGKTIEVEIPGEIKRIESSWEGKAKQEGAEGAEST
jgi:ABC-type sugar transport system substrate-binding protein